MVRYGASEAPEPAGGGARGGVRGGANEATRKEKKKSQSATTLSSKVGLNEQTL